MQKEFSEFHFTSFLKQVMANENYIEFRLESKGEQVKYYKILDGMYLYDQHLTFKDSNIDTSQYNNLLVTYYIYEGNYTIKTKNHKGETIEQVVRAGDVLRFAGDIKFENEFYQSDACGAVGLYCYYDNLLRSLKNFKFDTTKLVEFYKTISKYGFSIIDSNDIKYKYIANDIRKYLKEDNHYMVKIKALELLDWCVSHYSIKQKQYNKDYLKAIINVKNEIDNSPQENRSIAELARKCNMSETYFKKIFKDTFEYTPHKYILMKRLERAVYLLESTKKTIQTISEELNYASPSQFAKDFKRAYSCTPRDFRKSV